jgi:hypothetical protein
MTLVGTRVTIAAFVIALAAGFYPSGASAVTVTNHSSVQQASGQLKLSGVWQTSDGDKVRLTQSGSSITTTFLSDGSCPNGTQRQYYIQGQLAGTSLTGDVQRCTPVDLLQKCSLTDPWSAPIQMTASQDSITGTYHGQYYDFDYDSQGNFTGCHEDASKESDNPISLTRIPCDPSLLAKYQLEEAQAAAKFDAVDGQLTTVQYRNTGYLQEQGAQMVEIAVVKGELLAGLSEVGLEVVVHWVEKPATVLITTSIWLGQVTKEVIAEEGMLGTAQNMLADAQKASQQALDDFKKDINQNEACQDESDKASADQALKDQAQQMIDGWDQNPGGYLYQDPNDPTGVPLVAQAALQRARQYIQQGTRPLLRSLEAPGSPLAAARQQVRDGRALINLLKIAQKKGGTLRLTRTSAQAALKQIKKAIKLVGRVKTWEKKQIANFKAIHTALQPIIQHLLAPVTPPSS